MSILKGTVLHMAERTTLPLIPLSREDVERGLGKRQENIHIRIFDTIDSTNTEAKRQIREAGAHALPVTLLAARAQTDGRGRLGRSFYSPPDSGLYMTLAFPTSLPLDRLTYVTPLAAVAAARAIRATTGRQVDIKWVNDLYLYGRKVCGILTEAIAPAGPGTPAHLVVGWGINLTTRHFPEGLRAPAGSLTDPAPDSTADPAAAGISPFSVGILCGRVAAELLDLWECPHVPSPEALADYRAHSLLTGRRVICTWGGDTAIAANAAPVGGTVEGIGDGFELLVRRDDGSLLVMNSGEVSVRPID